MTERDRVQEAGFDNEAGNRTRADIGNGTYTTYGYDSDPRYRVSSMVRNVTSDPYTYTIDYLARDGAGNPTSMQDWTNPSPVTYGYDEYSRLEQTGGYDWVGNRNPGSWVYNAVDQLTATPSNQYHYLMTGSLLDRYNSTGTVLEKEYTYTYANLLSSVTHDDVLNTPVSSMTWDADSNRITFTSSQGGTTQFVYDTTAGIPAVIEEVLPSTQSLYYIREPDGSLIARMEGTTGANIRYYHFDALGSTKLLTDSTGAVTDKYTYDAWGALTNHEQLTGSVDQPYQYVGQLGYYTHYQDTNLPILQLGVRFYDSALGRFAQEDPIRYGLDWYAYADGIPTSLTDPTGFASQAPAPWPSRPNTDCDIYLRLRERARKAGDTDAANYYWLCYQVCTRSPNDAYNNCVRGCLQWIVIGHDWAYTETYGHGYCFEVCKKRETCSYDDQPWWYRQLIEGVIRAF